MGTEDTRAPGTTMGIFTRSWWSKKRVVAVGSIGATVVGVLAVVVPIAVAAGERTSSVDTIEVESQNSSDAGEGLVPEDEEASGAAAAIQPVTAGLSAAAGSATTAATLVPSEWFAVPVDAPWDELWAIPDVCTIEMRDWFAQHGTPIMPGALTSSITNAATAGSAATVSHIRAQGSLTQPPTNTVVVGAMGCTGGYDEGVFATMTLGVDPVAVFDECYSPSAQYSCAGSSEVVPNAGDPVTFDVYPGETRSLNLTWTQTMNFVGRFVADVTIDGTTSTIDLSPHGADLVVPAVTRPEMKLYFGLDSPWCESAPDARNSACGVDAWRTMLAAG